MSVPRPAERILIDLGIERPDQIDLDAIAWTMGAAVKYRPLDGCDAMIVGRQRRAIISVKNSDLPVRQRFSLAHEIGHWHHHRGRVLFCGAAEIGNPAHDALNPEYVADQFASDLLLPGFLFRPRILRMNRMSLAAARELAEEFRTSVTATLLKLTDSDRFPLVIVCHNKFGRRWFRRAPMVAGWWFPKSDLDAESIAFEMLHGGVSHSPYPRKIGADAWFDFRNADRFEIQEQSLLLPHDEVLAMLILPEEALGQRLQLSCDPPICANSVGSR